jgi:hypothetical protein
MERKWVARPYRYADGVPWNEDRYELFVAGEGGLVSIGGAIRSWDHRTVAFLCPKTLQRLIRSPKDAVNRTDGFYVIGASVKEALMLLKWRWPNPELTLLELAALQDFTFNEAPSPRRAPTSAEPVEGKKKEQA